jgi:hypothetical protein
MGKFLRKEQIRKFANSQSQRKIVDKVQFQITKEQGCDGKSLKLFEILHEFKTPAEVRR